MDDFRGGERVQPERRIALLDRAEEILVPLERQIRIVAALQQQLPAAERERLVDLPEDFLEAEDVAFGRSAPEEDELPYYLMRWDLDRAVVSRERIKERWSLVDTPGDLGFVQYRNLIPQLPVQWNGRSFAPRPAPSLERAELAA